MRVGEASVKHHDAEQMHLGLSRAELRALYDLLVDVDACIGPAAVHMPREMRALLMLLRLHFTGSPARN